MRYNGTFLFSDWLSSVDRRYGDQCRFSCGEDKLSFPALLDASGHCASILMEKGLKKDDRVLLLAVNGLDWLVSFFGIILAGGVAVLGNYAMNRHETSLAARLAGARWAVLGAEDIFGFQTGSVEEAVCEGGLSPSRILSCRDLYRQSLDVSRLPGKAFARLPEAFTCPGDTRVILFTTGSTSLPKAVQLSPEAILTNVCGAVGLGTRVCGAAGVLALPLFHCFGLAGMLMGMETGCYVCLSREITPQAVLEMIDQKKASLLMTVGTVCRLLVRLPEFPVKGAGRLKICYLGGSNLTAADLETLKKSLGGASIISGYGLTECGSVVSMSTEDLPEARRAASAGRILPCHEVGIWDKERGFLNPGETGEIVVKGPCLMNGYLGLPQEEQPFDGNGWLHTGDLGMIAEDGLLELKGRIKDLIKRAGENIAPGEIEEVLLSEPGVADARVFGIPDPVLGERVEACVVLQSGGTDERRLRASLRKKLSPHKIPAHIVALPCFPVSANGKIDQIRLRELLAERLGAAFPEKPDTGEQTS